MLEVLLIAVTVLVGLLILGVLAETAGFALGLSALAGWGLFRWYKGIWGATKSRTERIELAVLTVIMVAGGLSFVADLFAWLF